MIIWSWRQISCWSWFNSSRHCGDFIIHFKDLTDELQLNLLLTSRPWVRVYIHSKLTTLCRPSRHQQRATRSQTDKSEQPFDFLSQTDKSGRTFILRIFGYYYQDVERDILQNYRQSSNTIQLDFAGSLWFETKTLQSLTFLNFQAKKSDVGIRRPLSLLSLTHRVFIFLFM